MKKKAKKVKRVILGVGYPWYSTTATKGTGYTVLQMTETQVPQSILFRTGKEELVEFDVRGTGNYNKCRLVLEVLEQSVTTDRGGSVKTKIIIENRTCLSDVEALDRVKQVISKGRISKNGESYCHLTTFTDGTQVSAWLNKSSDRFVVCNN